MSLDMNMEFLFHMQDKSVCNCWSNISIAIQILIASKMGKADSTSVAVTSSYIIFCLYEHRKQKNLGAFQWNETNLEKFKLSLHCNDFGENRFTRQSTWTGDFLMTY